MPRAVTVAMLPPARTAESTNWPPAMLTVVMSRSMETTPVKLPRLVREARLRASTRLVPPAPRPPRKVIALMDAARHGTGAPWMYGCRL
jgi:hypothetical protein